MRVRVRFAGRVQGVGFRATARDVARGFPVSGWVRNEPDGDVMMEIQGEAGAIETVVAELHRRMSRNIERLDRAPMAEHPGEAGFEIRR